MIKTFVT